MSHYRKFTKFLGRCYYPRWSCPKCKSQNLEYDDGPECYRCLPCRTYCGVPLLAGIVAFTTYPLMAFGGLAMLSPTAAPNVKTVIFLIGSAAWHVGWLYSAPQVFALKAKRNQNKPGIFYENPAMDKPRRLS